MIHLTTELFAETLYSELTLEKEREEKLQNPVKFCPSFWPQIVEHTQLLGLGDRLAPCQELLYLLILLYFVFNLEWLLQLTSARSGFNSVPILFSQNSLLTTLRASTVRNNCSISRFYCLEIHNEIWIKILLQSHFVCLWIYTSEIGQWYFFNFN